MTPPPVELPVPIASAPVWTPFERPSARCRACGLWQTSRVHALPGEGSPYAQIALVGEGPGEQEEADERNFVGRAGEILDGCLREAGLIRSELWICNTARCRPTTAVGKNRKPTMHEVDCCRGYTVDELRERQPKVIVALGDIAMTALLGKQLGGITQHRGRVVWSDEFNAWVIATFHPAYVLRRYAERHWIVADLREAKRLLEEGSPRIGPPTQIEVVTDLDRAREVRDIILNALEVAYDWETNGVHLVKARGFCVSFAIDERHAFVIPRYGENWTTIWGKYLRALDDEVLKPIFLSDVTKLGFHIAFDNNITRSTLGVWPRNASWCVMLAHHLLNNHLGERAHDLKVLAAAHTDMGRYDDPLDQWLVANGHTVDGKPDYFQLWRAPNDIVWQYNGMDSDATLRLKRLFAPQIIENGLAKIWEQERRPLVVEHQEVDRIGVRIDEPYLDQLSEQLGSALERLEAEISEHAGAPLNPASHPQVAKLLFDDLDLPILARTDAGAPSTKEEVLLQLKEMHPVINLVLAHRAHAKIKGTYVDGTGKTGQKKALRAVIDDDGYARMSTRLQGTETFRFVTRKPFAIHTWPKTDPKSGIPSVRALIIPDDGCAFIERDYVQQEFAIQAVAAEQWDIVEAMLDRGEDVHERVTQDLGGVAKANYLITHVRVGDQSVPLDRALADGIALAPDSFYLMDGAYWRSRGDYDEYKKQRQKWKSVNFMILFRGGAKKLARMALGCTSDLRSMRVCAKEGVVDCGCESAAASYIREYHERYEQIHWWQYRTIKELRRTGKVIGLFSTYRILPGIFDPNKWVQLEAERQACNFPVQNGGAHVMIRALLRTQAEFRRRKFPGRVVVSIHDQLIVQVRMDLIEEGDYIVRRCMEAPYPELAGRSLRTDCQVTHCWGG